MTAALGLPDRRFLSILLLLVSLLAGCGQAQPQGPTTLYAPESYPGGALLVTPQWLHDHVNDPSLRVIDLSPIRDYQSGHVPGAVHLWWQDTIEVHNDVYGMMVGEDGFQSLIRQAGITPDSTVVLYDADGDRYAARFLWVLNFHGFTRVHLLDGGSQSGREAGFSLDRGTPQVQAGSLPSQIDYSVLISADEVRDHLNDGTLAIVDNRTMAERTDSWYGTLRLGRIPGAAMIPWDALTQRGRVPYYASADDLRARLEEAGIKPDKTVVVYGIDGVEAAQSYVALKLLGYASVKVYDGSWAEWGSRADLPVEPLPGGTP